MSSFFSIVNRETVLSFGVKPCDWDEDDQAYLHEAMIIAWKENPDWTDEEAKAACKEQVDRILYQNFKRTYGRLLKEAICLWQNTPQAFEAYKEMGMKKFEEALNEEAEYQEFGEEFYSELREMYNICGAGMRDAFNSMKAKGWSFDDYRKDLKEQRRKLGYKW